MTKDYKWGVFDILPPIFGYRETTKHILLKTFKTKKEAVSYFDLMQFSDRFQEIRKVSTADIGVYDA